MTTSTCPDQDLILPTAGKLADANLESVDNHIGECLECQTVLETLDESPDTLVIGSAAVKRRILFKTRASAGASQPRLPR